MKTETNEIEKAITKTIANYKLEIDKHNKKVEYYQGGIKKLNETLSFFKKGTSTNRGGARPNAGRKKLKKGSKETNSTQTVTQKNVKTNIPLVKWDSVIIPLLEKTGKPMNISDIANNIFKGKHGNTKKVLRTRLSGALTYMKKEGKLKGFDVEGVMNYGLPNMAETK